MNSFINFIDLAFPVFVAIALIVLQFSIIKKDDLKVTIPLYGMGSIEMSVSNLMAIRIILLMLALVTISMPAFRDYTQYFPTRLKMDVFFDTNGIDRSLLQFSDEELASLNLVKNWKPSKEKYLKKLNSDLNEAVGISRSFSMDDNYIHSGGYTSFKVEKINGWQKYRIAQAEGKLSHNFTEPQSPSFDFSSEFTLLNKPSNFIDVDILDIYLRFTKIIKPEFMQNVNVSAIDRVYHHDLIAVTKVRFFPIVNIGRTIYFIREGNKIVPIGYCIYSPE